jgi:DNA-binding MarR family transcriptional regulator
MNPQDCIFFQLAKAHQAGTRFWTHKLSGFHVTAVQGMVLGFLSKNDRITARELGQRTLLDSATLTGILDRIEKAELIQRRPHPEDRRALQVCLTPGGRDLADTLLEVGIVANQDFLGRLTPEEQMIFRVLLKKLRGKNPG